MPGPQPGAAAVDLRHDLHPLVAKGLGLEPERAPAREEIGAMLAGRRADGKKIEGKHYPEVRTVTDKRTGQTKELIPDRRLRLHPDAGQERIGRLGVRRAG